MRIRPSAWTLVVLIFCVFLFAGLASIPSIFWRARHAEVKLADAESSLEPLKSDQASLHTVMKAIDAPTPDAAVDQIASLKQKAQQADHLQSSLRRKEEEWRARQQSFELENKTIARLGEIREEFDAVRQDMNANAATAKNQIAKLQQELIAWKDAQGWSSVAASGSTVVPSPRACNLVPDPTPIMCFRPVMEMPPAVCVYRYVYP